MPKQLGMTLTSQATGIFMNDFIGEIPEQKETELSTPEASKRVRKAKEEKAVAEVISVKVKLKLLRDCHIDGQLILAGNIVEVDEATAAEMTRIFPVPNSFYGYRPGKVQETIKRAEKVN